MPKTRAVIGLFFFGVLAASLSGCAFGRIESHSDASARQVPVYSSYRWLTQEDVRTLKLENPNVDYLTGTVRVVQRPEVEDRVRSRVEDDLRRNGMRPEPVGTPDVFVTFYGKAANDDWVSSWQGMTQGVGGVPVVIFPEFDRGRAFRHHDGVVYLTFYDSRSQKPVWAGSVDLLTLGRDYSQSQVASAVDDLVDEFGDFKRRG